MCLCVSVVVVVFEKLLNFRVLELCQNFRIKTWLFLLLKSELTIHGTALLFTMQF